MSDKKIISKVSVLLEAIKESKQKYIAVISPETGEKVMMIKHNLTDDSYIDFLDTFFDHGFKIEAIDKKDFDSLSDDDVLSFNI